MKTSLLLSLFAASALMGGNLVVTKGSVKAHTEVLVDSHIDPVTSTLVSHLTMPKGIESIRGSVEVSLKDLKSDKADRDEHMEEAIESAKFPMATYTFRSVTKQGNGYTIDGVLKFHNVSKPLKIKASISEKDGKVHLNGNASFKMSSYGVQPPKLLLMTVRDRVDLAIDVNFNER